MTTTSSGWRYLLGFSGGNISPASLKRIEVIKFFYSQKILSEAMRYKVIKLLLIIQKLKG